MIYGLTGEALKSAELVSNPAGPVAPGWRVRGRLRLRFEARGDSRQTVVAECEQQAPLRVVRAFHLDDGGSLIHLHNLSGGVLGGDHFDIDIAVGPRAVAQVTSTGATRIYRPRRDAGPARQRLQIRVEDDGLIE